jgi:hypothetical protein
MRLSHSGIVLYLSRVDTQRWRQDAPGFRSYVTDLVHAFAAKAPGCVVSAMDEHSRLVVYPITHDTPPDTATLKGM